MSAEITEFIDPYGTFTTLDVDWSAQGRFMPAVVHIDDKVPGMPGGRHRESRHDVHEFTIKHTITGTSEAAVRAAQRALVSAMDPTRGEGRIRVTSPIGDVREIPVYYVTGLEMDESPGNSGITMQVVPITFRAYDPYWRDTSPISPSPFTIGVTPTFFPIFPVRLTASQIAVDTVATNAGDVSASPTWTLTGPGSTIYLRNLTTGEVLWFDSLSLGAGEQLTIDTSIPRVEKQDGSNQYPYLNIGSTLWALRPGSNALRLEMAGAIAGQSSLQLSYWQKYLSP